MRAAAAVITLAALAATPAAAQDAHQPIEGVWGAGQGRTLVEATGPNTFTGTIVRGTDPRRCSPDSDGFVHPFGASVWNATGTGGSYSGTVAYFDARCRVLGQGQATWTTSGTSLRLCANRPGGGPPTLDSSGMATGTTSCANLVRVAPPGPAPTFASAVTMPSVRRCVSLTSFAIRFHDRSNDPLRAAKVSVNGTVRRNVTGAPLTGSIVLHRMPRGRAAVRVVVTTATRSKLVGLRRYRSCA